MLPEKVKISIETRYFQGIVRDIRSDLSSQEKAVLKNIQVIIELLEKKKFRNVFVMGDYTLFLEGIIPNYKVIRIYAIDDGYLGYLHFAEINQVLRNNMEKCNIKNIGELFGLKNIIARRRNDSKLLPYDELNIWFYKYKINFINAGEIVIHFTVTHDYQYNKINPIENIYRVLQEFRNTKGHAVLLPHSNSIFRIKSFTKKIHKRNDIICYGKPFSLLCQCATYLKIFLWMDTDP